MKNNILNKILSSPIESYNLMDNILEYKKSIINNISKTINKDITIDTSNKTIITKDYILKEI